MDVSGLLSFTVIAVSGKLYFPLRLIYFKFNGSGEAFERLVKFFTLDFFCPRKDNTVYNMYFLVKNLLKY